MLHMLMFSRFRRSRRGHSPQPNLCRDPEFNALFGAKPVNYGADPDNPERALSGRQGPVSDQAHAARPLRNVDRDGATMITSLRVPVTGLDRLA